MTERCDRCGREYPPGHCKEITHIAFKLKTVSEDIGKVEKEQYSEKVDNGGGSYCKKCIDEIVEIINDSFDIRIQKN